MIFGVVLVISIVTVLSLYKKEQIKCKQDQAKIWDKNLKTHSENMKALKVHV